MAQTAQEWMRLGYPQFVAVSLEEMVDDDQGEPLSELQVAEMSVEDLLEMALHWNGIIGYTGSILGAVRGLDALKRGDAR